MAYGDFKNLSRRTASDKRFCDKALNIAKNPEYDGCQSGLSSMLYNIFDKKKLLLGMQINLMIVYSKWKYLKQRISLRITQTKY